MIQRKMSDITLTIYNIHNILQKTKMFWRNWKNLDFTCAAVTNSLQIHGSNFRITRDGVMCAVHQYVLHFSSDQNGFPHPVHRQNSEVNQ